MKKINSKKFDFSKCSCDFSLIFLIFLFVTYPKEMKSFSHSILGRFAAVMMIVLYTMFDVFYGFLFCIVVIYYYQLDNSLNTHEGFFWEWVEDSGKKDLFDKKVQNTTVYMNYKPENIYQAEGSNFNINSISNTLPIDSLLPEIGENEQKFRDENCSSGILKLNDLEVNPEMSEHIFHELKFDNLPCNPCNPHCKFSIIDKKIRTEEELIKPKSSNEWLDIIQSNLHNAYSPTSNYLQ